MIRPECQNLPKGVSSSCLTEHPFQLCAQFKMHSQSESTSKPPKPVKLRESCDSCLIAKVKCSKARPLCGRCLTNGAPCAYSPSSRSGKRNRNANVNGVTKSIDTPVAQTNGCSKAPESPKSAVPPTTLHSNCLKHPPLYAADRPLLEPNTGTPPRKSLPLHHDRVDVTASSVESGSSAPHDGSFDTSDFLPCPFPQGDFMESIVNDNADPFPATVLSSPELKPENMLVNQPWPNTAGSCSLYAPIRNTVTTIPTHQISFSHATQRSSIPPACSSPKFSTNYKSTHSTPDVSQSCDCFASCLIVLQNLHNHSPLLSSKQHGGPPFDIVLTINRDAIDCCSTMLECVTCIPKNGRSISTMILATVFGKVMSLYRAACSLRFGPSSSMHSTTQLAFGAYTVTNENRELLEIEIFLLELRKVECILRVYSERFRDSQIEKNDESGVYNALTTYLNKNLQYIVEFLQMRRKGSMK